MRKVIFCILALLISTSCYSQENKIIKKLLKKINFTEHIFIYKTDTLNYKRLSSDFYKYAFSSVNASTKEGSDAFEYINGLNYVEICLNSAQKDVTKGTPPNNIKYPLQNIINAEKVYQLDIIESYKNECEFYDKRRREIDEKERKVKMEMEEAKRNAKKLLQAKLDSIAKENQKREDSLKMIKKIETMPLKPLYCKGDTTNINSQLSAWNTGSDGMGWHKMLFVFTGMDVNLSNYYLQGFLQKYMDLSYSTSYDESKYEQGNLVIREKYRKGITNDKQERSIIVKYVTIPTENCYIIKRCEISGDWVYVTDLFVKYWNFEYAVSTSKNVDLYTIFMGDRISYSSDIKQNKAKIIITPNK